MPLKRKKKTAKSCVVYAEKKHVLSFCFHHLMCSKKPCWKCESGVCSVGWRAYMAAQMLRFSLKPFCSLVLLPSFLFICANE